MSWENALKARRMGADTSQNHTQKQLNAEPVTEDQLYRGMKSAIERIADASRELRYETILRTGSVRDVLSKLPLDSIEDISRWESLWFKHINESKERGIAL